MKMMKNTRRRFATLMMLCLTYASTAVVGGERGKRVATS